MCISDSIKNIWYLSSKLDHLDIHAMYMYVVCGYLHCLMEITNVWCAFPAQRVRYVYIDTVFVITCYVYGIIYLLQILSIRQHGQDTKEEISSRDLRTELELKEREAKEKREGKTRSFTG